MKPLAAFYLLPLVLTPSYAMLDPHVATPPVAEKKPKDVTVHGDHRGDDFFWLREKENPAVLNYLKSENAYTDAVMGPTKPLQEKLYQEMVGHIKETDASAPAPKNGYFYYSRTEQGKQYSIYCRKKAALEAPEEVVIDLNKLAEGQKFMAISAYEISDDNKFLAYSVDHNGHRDYQLYVKDLTTNQDLTLDIGTASSVAWAADSDTLFYAVEEQPSKRSYQLWSLSISKKQKTLLYEEKDDIFDIDVTRSDDGRYVFCTSESKTTTEVRFVSADHPAEPWRVVMPRQTDHEYHVGHRNGLFYIRTNKNAKNFRIVTAPVSTPDESHWTEFLPHRLSIKLSNLQLFALYAVTYERENGLPQLRVIDFETHQEELIPMPEPTYEVAPERNMEFKTTVFRYRYESLVSPPSVYAYDMASRTRVLLKQTEVPGYDRVGYKSERIFATASDGTKIPMSVVYRADLDRSHGEPTWLYGYGSYGVSMPVRFSSARLSVLDRGMIYVIAHVRGGGELGEPWRDAGKMERKMTTFTDFIACAEHLISQHYTTPAQLSTSGGSAGGLLMGAVLNLRPDLFHAAILDVPFVDVLNTMLDASLPLTTAEYIEWGNPNVEKEYHWMRAYSPYDNLAAKAYPSMLVNTSLNDSQVPYWEGTKYVAKLRTLRTDSHPLLLHINLDAGHGGSSGRYDSLREAARNYAFLLTELGLDR